MTVLTPDHVASIMPNAVANGLRDEWQHLLEACRRYEINTKNRLAAFLMNVAKESGELFYVEEIDEGWYLEGRGDLGNIVAGDGPRFKGHGYIQITGRNNHKTVGDALGVDAISDPLVLTRMPYAWLSAGYYWRYMSSWGNLNEYADAGDFRSTILGVRGGPDADREHYWRTAMEALPDDLELPEGEGSAAETQGDIDGWPTLRATLDANGWARRGEKYLALPERPDAELVTKGPWVRAGKLWTPPPKEEKEAELPEAETVYVEDWPWAWHRPGYLGDGSYVDLHPTRYTWEPIIDALMRRIVNRWPGRVWPVTYVDHPPGWGLDAVSFDLWDYAGRGYALDRDLHDEALNFIYYDPNPPYIRWYISKGTIWDPYNGARAYWDTDPWSDARHDKHLHVTCFSTL